MKPLTTHFAKLVTILNDGQYHDSAMLVDQLNLTSKEISQAIKKLKSYDIKIDYVKGKGYALLEPLILLDKKIIKASLTDDNIDLHLFETIDSTNNYLTSLPKNNSTINICIAEQQTRGKGRLHRDWYSPFGQNIYFSCSYYFQKDVSELAGLSLVVGLSITKTLERFGLPHSPKVKWPNDVLYDDKKISGNLIEIQAESHGISHAIIGIGINVNMILKKNIPISQAWTSLRNITGHYINRNQFIITLIEQLMDSLHLFEKHGLSFFIEEWNAADCLFNKNIYLKNGEKKISGRASGINELGHLILTLKNGKLESFSSGDTTIIKK